MRSLCKSHLSVEVSIAKNSHRVPVETRTNDKSEPFSLAPDGHIVGQDGFVVPKDFEEFYQRYPTRVRRWLIKKLHKRTLDDSVLELEQELLAYLCCLPRESKHRQRGMNGHAEGCRDVIQCFDPVKHYGANGRRFFNFVFLCLTNRLSTILTKQNKEPVCQTQTVGISDGVHSQVAGQEHSRQEVNSEYVCEHSSVLGHYRKEGCTEPYFQRILIGEFKTFLRRNAPDLLPVIEAIANTATMREAGKSLGINEYFLNQRRQRLQVLRDHFLNGRSSMLS
jgi:hypothetical protein